MQNVKLRSFLEVVSLLLLIADFGK